MATLNKIVGQKTSQYCDESSIHGFLYLAPSRQSWLRLLWTGLLTVALYLSYIVVKSLLDHWSNNPIVTSIGTTEYPIQKISFPAVTVCSNAMEPWSYIERFNFLTFQLSRILIVFFGLGLETTFSWITMKFGSCWSHYGALSDMGLDPIGSY